MEEHIVGYNVLAGNHPTVSPVPSTNDRFILPRIGPIEDPIIADVIRVAIALFGLYAAVYW
jgi:hypothetical protein